MKLIFLGTGSAFTVGDGNYHSNMMIQSDSGRNLLVDCGGDARFSLYEQGFSYGDVHSVYISHLHADHVGGLEWLGFTTKFDPRLLPKPELFICETLVEKIWNSVLSGGLSSLTDRKPNLSTYFNVKVINLDLIFRWEGVVFKLVKTIHNTSNEYIYPSYGLFFSVNEKNIFITTDTQYTPEYLMPYYQKADLIFQDCETAATKTGCHSHFSELGRMDPNIKKKMWLYHYQPGQLPNAIKAGFKGFVKKGDVFEF